jgi:hypothetical protein
MSFFGRLAFALVLLLMAREPAAAVERVLLFISDATVARSGEVSVTETIRVQAEGNDIRAASCAISRPSIGPAMAPASRWVSRCSRSPATAGW